MKSRGFHNCDSFVYVDFSSVKLFEQFLSGADDETTSSESVSTDSEHKECNGRDSVASSAAMEDVFNTESQVRGRSCSMMCGGCYWKSSDFNSIHYFLC